MDIVLNGFLPDLWYGLSSLGLYFHFVLVFGRIRWSQKAIPADPMVGLTFRMARGIQKQRFDLIELLRQDLMVPPSQPRLNGCALRRQPDGQGLAGGFGLLIADRLFDVLASIQAHGHDLLRRLDGAGQAIHGIEAIDRQ